MSLKAENPAKSLSEWREIDVSREPFLRAFRKSFQEYMVYKTGGTIWMIKKLLAACLVLTLIFTPVGDFIFHQNDNEVSAKGGYRSGIKSFNSTKTNNSGSLFGNKQQQRTTTNGTAATSQRNFTGGSFMRGMIFGGLSGFLFGSLLSQLGGFGMMAGLLINILAVVAIIALIRYLIGSFTNRSKKRQTGDSDSWRR